MKSEIHQGPPTLSSLRQKRDLVNAAIRAGQQSNFGTNIDANRGTQPTNFGTNTDTQQPTHTNLVNDGAGLNAERSSTKMQMMKKLEKLRKQKKENK